MLSAKQNFLETIHGGNPERLVNQFEFMEILVDPVFIGCNKLPEPGETCVNGWGITMYYKPGSPGPFPLHGEKTVLNDITQWKTILQAPPTKYPEEAWAPFVEMADRVDRNEKFVAPLIVPGIFEKMHNLMGMEQTMINFYDEPEAMHDLIDFLVDWEIEGAKETIAHLHPDAYFHHDDWGSQNSTFFSMDMFDEFLFPAYEKLYGFYRENGIELIVHHSDSYAATLVPRMINLGIDVWQGCLSTNNIPDLIAQYGGQISFMGGLDNGRIDKMDWTSEKIEKEVKETCRKCGTQFFIPCMTMGGIGSAYDGVYDAVSESIAKLSHDMF